MDYSEYLRTINFFTHAPFPLSFHPRICFRPVKISCPLSLAQKNVQTSSFSLLFVQRLVYNWRKKVWIDAHACYVGNQVSSKSRATGVSRELQFSVGRDRRSIDVRRSIRRRSFVERIEWIFQESNMDVTFTRPLQGKESCVECTKCCFRFSNASKLDRRTSTRIQCVFFSFLFCFDEKPDVFDLT